MHFPNQKKIQVEQPNKKKQGMLLRAATFERATGGPLGRPMGGGLSR